LAPARTRLARKQNAGLLVGSPSFADTASRVLLTPPAAAAASQKWKIIYLQVLKNQTPCVRYYITQTDRFVLSSLRKQGTRTVSAQWIPACAGMTNCIILLSILRQIRKHVQTETHASAATDYPKWTKFRSYNIC